MFGRKRRQQATMYTLVAAETRVHGDVDFSGRLLIDGFIRGNVSAVDDAGASLTISERGSVEGAVTVPSIVLNGTVEGDVTASARVELGPKARVRGNVHYKLIEMAIGAEVNGKLIHECDTRNATGEQAAGTAFSQVRAVNAVGE